MCGICAIVSHGKDNNQLLIECLRCLRHRGYDCWGVATLTPGSPDAPEAPEAPRGQIHLQHSSAPVTTSELIDITSNFDETQLHFSLAHTRYTTFGSHTEESQTQPLISEDGNVVLVHNGQVRIDSAVDSIKQGSDSAWLLNVLSECLANISCATNIETFIELAFRRLFCQVAGSYACVSLVKNVGMFAFRDTRGIRPLIMGFNSMSGLIAFASESCGLPEGCDTVMDVLPGQVVFIDITGEIHFLNPLGRCFPQPQLCLFEFIYLANSASVIDGISVQHAREKMGQLLAPDVIRFAKAHHIDAIVPIPHTPVLAGKRLSEETGIPLIELLDIISRRSSGESRTFILPTAAARETAVRMKFELNNEAALKCCGKAILLLDDSIVRGTTLRHVIRLLREQINPCAIYVASLSPAVISANIYGIDIPEAQTLIAHCSDPTSVAKELNLDAPVIYQRLDVLKRGLSPDGRGFEDSVFRPSIGEILGQQF